MVDNNIELIPYLTKFAEEQSKIYKGIIHISINISWREIDYPLEKDHFRYVYFGIKNDDTILCMLDKYYDRNDIRPEIVNIPIEELYMIQCSNLIPPNDS